MNDRHEVEWIPPAALDTGQGRVNTVHRPERLVAGLAEPDPAAEPGGPAPPRSDAA